MSVDKYAICPCGSGKKIKFCTKCSESLHELDEVLNMVEGGQVVPALDRLSSILSEHPDAAWALAIRGRLLLDLREYKSLTENAERFIRLQPSNPLALTQRAAASLFAGNSEQATESMLQALTESGRDVDAFVLDVASVLAYSLAQQGVFLTARVYATLAMMASGYEGGQTAMAVLGQLNSAPTISQLLKAVPSPIARPADVEWGERYDEAAGLLRSNKVDLAEAKFASLRRTLPNEPAIISGLLTCAIWRGDVAAQAELFKKLSDCKSLDFEQRVRFRAIAAMVDPQGVEISIPVLNLVGEIKNAEEADMAFLSNSRFVSLPADLLNGMKTSDDDVPPRSGYQLLDREKPESLDKLPPISEVPEALALVFVYGRQTDREARIEVLDVRQDNLDEIRKCITSAVDGIELKEDASEAMPLLVAGQPAIAMIRYHASPIEAEKLQSELIASRMPTSLANLKLPLLGGKSLSSSADDDSLLLERNALMRIIEQYDAIASKGEAIIDEVYKLAKLTSPPTLSPTSAEAEELANEDLSRVDPAELDVESLIYLLQRSQQVSATAAMRRIAKRLITLDLTGDQKSAKLLAYMTLMRSAEKNEEAIAYVEQAKAYAEANSLPTANLLLSEITLRLQAGDAAGFQSTIQSLTSKYGNHPEVMARLQQMLVQYGLLSPDGSPRRGPGAGGGQPQASSGGLWTPESGSPTAAAGKGGGGKLWVPGMD
jgi:tetratricopeptide (TPR) repeat protein